MTQDAITVTGLAAARSAPLSRSARARQSDGPRDHVGQRRLRPPVPGCPAVDPARDARDVIVTLLAMAMPAALALPFSATNR